MEAEGAELGHFTPAEVYGRYLSFEQQAFEYRMRVKEKGEKIKTRIVGRIEKADFS